MYMNFKSDNYITSEKLNIDDFAKPLLISYDNNPQKTTFNFIKSLNNNDWEYIFIGKGEKWISFKNKIIGYYNFLKLLPPQKIVILSDARDVFCCRSPNKFRDSYNSIGKKLITSMELFCDGHMDVNELTHIPHQCTPLTKYWKYANVVNLPNRKFVNSGLICGTVEQCLHAFEWINESMLNDDQLALGMYINAFPEKVYLDINAEILHTSGFAVTCGLYKNKIQKEDSPTLAELFGRGAFFLHIPGCANKGQKLVYDCISNLMDLNINDKRLRLPYNYTEPEWNE